MRKAQNGIILIQRGVANHNSVAALNLRDCQSIRLHFGLSRRMGVTTLSTGRYLTGRKKSGRKGRKNKLLLELTWSEHASGSGEILGRIEGPGPAGS